MKQIHIERHQVEGATRSVWQIGRHTFYGIEQPWRDNVPYKSCFPAGVYSLIPWSSPRHGECFAFIGGSVSLKQDDLAPPAITRFLCLVHVANYADDVEGCFGLGMRIGRRDSDGAAAVWKSRFALARLKEILGEDPYHTAYIKWAA